MSKKVLDPADTEVPGDLQFQEHLADPLLKNPVRPPNLGPLRDNTISGRVKRDITGLRELLND